MKIGVPKEIKSNEYRVGLVPLSICELIEYGHEVFVESKAGLEAGFVDDEYKIAGAKILKTAKEVFEVADMIVKVKEPQPQECKMLKKGQILFTYLHLASNPTLAKDLLASEVIAMAYETVTDCQGHLPLLIPMSEIAGRMSIQVGAHILEKTKGGRGILLGGVPGVKPGRVTIVGGGTVGANAARMAIGLGADVTIIDKSMKRLRELEDLFPSKVQTIVSTCHAIGEHLIGSDLVIGAVLVPGGETPKIIKKEHIKKMRPGSVFIDVAIDQGGTSETSRPTTQDNPTYVIYDVIHYCVTNIPGIVPRTSALALNNATLSYILKIANEGYKTALLDDSCLMSGLNVCCGRITNRAVAESLGYIYTPAEEVLKITENKRVRQSKTKETK